MSSFATTTFAPWTGGVGGLIDTSLPFSSRKRQKPVVYRFSKEAKACSVPTSTFQNCTKLII